MSDSRVPARFFSNAEMWHHGTRLHEDAPLGHTRLHRTEQEWAENNRLPR